MTNTNGQPHRELEINGDGRARRLRGLVAYLLLVAVAAGLLVLLFMRFTGSLRLAVVLVTFMLTYMIVMGALASRRAKERDI